MSMLLRAALLLLVAVPLFVTTGFHAALWQIFVAAVLGSGLGQLAVRATRARPRAGWILLAAIVILLGGSVALLSRPAQQSVLRRRVIVVSNGPTPSAPSLTSDDATALQGLGEVSAIAPVRRVNGMLTTEDANWTTMVMGTTPVFFEVRGWRTARGEPFTASDVDSAAKVMVVGQTIASELFGAVDPVGQIVRIKSTPFTVVGVLAPVLAPVGPADEDDVALVPLTTFTRSISPGLEHVFSGQFWILPRDRAPSEPLRALLRDRHHVAAGADDDFILKDLK